MTYLHSRTPPIIHRDLKTPNVLLMSLDPNNPGPLAKVSDFGASAQMFMSSLQSGTIGSDDKAKKHVVTLTTWLAPEILIGQHYSKPSDVYAVGIMMWELLTRRHPFDHLGSVMNEVKVRQKVPSNDPDNRPPVPKDGPKDYCELMCECWCGDPEKRPTMAEVGVSLCVV
jgi:serine/threonine protein kinase